MGFPSDQSSFMLAPVGGGSAPNAETLLSGTGTTESSNTTALVVESMATLYAGNSSIRVSFRALGAQASQVSLTSLLLQAGSRFDWTVTDLTKFVYVEAGDAVSAYQAWVWTSSP